MCYSYQEHGRPDLKNHGFSALDCSHVEILNVSNVVHALCSLLGKVPFRHQNVGLDAAVGGLPDCGIALPDKLLDLDNCSQGTRTIGLFISDEDCPNLSRWRRRVSSARKRLHATLRGS